MIGLIILIAWIIILMTRMIAQMCKNTMESKENKGAAFGRAPQGRGAPLWLFSLLSLVFLHIWAIVLVSRMIIQAIRMISPIILYHPILMYKPVYSGMGRLDFRGI